MVALLLILAIVAFYFLGGAVRDRVIETVRRWTRELREADRRAGAVDRFPRATIPTDVATAVLLVVLPATGEAAWLLLFLPVFALSITNVYVGGEFDDSIPTCVRRVWPLAQALLRGEQPGQPSTRFTAKQPPPPPGPQPSPPPPGQQAPDQQVRYRPGRDGTVRVDLVKAEKPAVEATAPAQSIEAVTPRGVAVPSLGISVAKIGPDSSADVQLMVTSIRPAAPAATIGMRVGDELLRFGGLPLASPEALLEALTWYDEGDAVDVMWLSGGQQRSAAVVPDLQISEAGG